MLLSRSRVSGTGTELTSQINVLTSTSIDRELTVMRFDHFCICISYDKYKITITSPHVIRLSAFTGFFRCCNVRY